MQIIPVSSAHLEIETECGHNFSIYSLVGGGIEIHPQLPENVMIGETLHSNRSALDSHNSIDRVVLRIWERK